MAFRALALRIRSDDELKLKASASESLYGGQLTLSTQLIKPNYPVTITLSAKVTQRKLRTPQKHKRNTRGNIISQETGYHKK